MQKDQLKEQVLELMAGGAYMPMRKRGLAKALDIDDENYHAFKHMLDEMVSEGVVAELKRGKYGLPRGERPLTEMRFQPPHVKLEDDEAEAELETAEEFDPESGRSGGREDEHAERTDFRDRNREKKKYRLDEPIESHKAPPAQPNTHNKGGGAKDAPLPKGAVTGRIDVKRGGMAFLLSEPPGNDIFIHETDIGGAVSGDLVAVMMEHQYQRTGRGKSGGGNRGFRRSGKVIRIIERAHKLIVGTFYVHRRAQDQTSGVIGHIQPDTYGMFNEIEVLAEDRGGAKDMDKVAAELVEPKNTHRLGAPPTARVIKIYGQAGEADADILAIVENHNVKTKFPEEVLQQAEDIPEEIPAEELAQRTNYEHPVTFTIDPQDAKDHDDAVALRKEEDGRWTLLVHIADVSHYVREGSPIDIEARDRATSVYLPGQVYPMLPHKLSNNVCSLKEGKVRLTKTVSMTFGKNFTMQQIKIERSYIRSAAFLTYNNVKDALDDNKPELLRTPEILKACQEMREFALALRQKRLASGSLELELPEAKLLLDDKMEVKGWAMEEHHWAHELIEDMMLAANRAVAEYCVEHELPALYRIHEEPDPEALDRFSEFVREFGMSISPPIDRLKLKSVLDRVKGKEYAHTIHLALLTSLKQAKYSAECQPHFALNFSRYLHFTSPIRRYPDLIVHRALDSRFEPGKAELPIHGKKRKGGDGGRDYHAQMDFLRPLATHCSMREREAAAAESEVIKFRQMQFLRRNMKEAHPGIITRVRDFGLFVELQDCYVEGLVQVRDLADDYYVYYENQHLLQGKKNGRSFQLGDKVSVRIIHMDLGKKQVTLEIV